MLLGRNNPTTPPFPVCIAEQDRCNGIDSLLTKQWSRGWNSQTEVKQHKDVLIILVPLVWFYK